MTAAELSPDELALIEAYRSMPADSREVLLAAAIEAALELRELT